MRKKKFVYDLTRLASRRYQDTPSGIDRIDIRFADDMLKKRGENCHFVVYVFGSLKLIPNPVAERLINELFARWEDSQPANYSVARIIDRKFLAPNFDYLEDRSDATSNTRKRFSNILGKGISFSPTLFSYLKGRYFSQSSNQINRKLRDIFEKHDCNYLTFAHTGFARNPNFADFCDEYNVQTIAYIHDLIPIEYPQYCKPDSAQRFQQFIDQLLKAAPLVLTNSNATQKSLKNYIQNHKNADIHALSLEMHTLYPGISTKEPDPDFVPPSNPYFVMLGTIEPRKNHALILDIWEELIEEKKDNAPTLYIIGKRGWLNNAVFKRLDILKQKTHKIIELGNLTSQGAINYLASANALLFPSHCEGLGIPTMEAMKVGTPTVANKLNIYKEFDQGSFIFAKEEDIEDWKNHIIQLSMNNNTSANLVTFNRNWNKTISEFHEKLG